MKHLLISTTIIFLSLLPISTSYAITADTSTLNTTQVTNERTTRGELKARHQNGTIETTVGTYTVSASVEVIDHRPIDDWYKKPADAQVSLYFKDDRLVRIVIY
jgi:hypothetical protein